MIQQTTPQNDEGQKEMELASALLQLVPKILSRLAADVPLDSDVAECDTAMREVAELRTTPGQLSLLRVLVEHKRCMMQELAEHLAVTPSTATAMVKRLPAQGYVERSRDDVDWRAVWVRPTERGQRAVEVFEQARLVSLQRRLDKLSEEERKRVKDALPALHHLIEA